MVATDIKEFSEQKIIIWSRSMASKYDVNQEIELLFDEFNL